MQKKTVVYGATGGIGREIAMLLDEDGNRLHLVARDEGKTESLANEVQALER